MPQGEFRRIEVPTPLFPPAPPPLRPSPPLGDRGPRAPEALLGARRRAHGLYTVDVELPHFQAQCTAHCRTWSAWWCRTIHFATSSTGTTVSARPRVSHQSVSDSAEVLNGACSTGT